MVLIKESDEFLSADVEICVQMITFVTLWKLKKFADAKEYLESAASILNKIVQSIIDSKMSKNSSQNLYTLIVMSLAALKIVLENNTNEALYMCEDCKSQLEQNSLCYKLLMEYINKISTTKNLQKEDFLITEIYQKVLFVTTFMPLISPNTPLVKVSDLESEQEHLTGVGGGGEEINSVVSYKGVSSKERLDTSRVSRRACRSTPRSNMVKPWWESNKIFDKIPRNRAQDSSFRSEPRGKPLDKHKFSPALLMPKLPKRQSRDSLYSEISAVTRGKDVRAEEKELIMFEFNPGIESNSGEYQIQLVPLTMFKTRNNPKDRPLTNFNIQRTVNLG